MVELAACDDWRVDWDQRFEARNRFARVVECFATDDVDDRRQRRASWEDSRAIARTAGRERMRLQMIETTQVPVPHRSSYIHVSCPLLFTQLHPHYQRGIISGDGLSLSRMASTDALH